jgi:hypothetical protein
VPLVRLDAPVGHEWKIERLPLPLFPEEPARPRTSARVALLADSGSLGEADRVAGKLRLLGVDVDAIPMPGYDPSDYLAAVAVQGALSTPGFTTFLARSVSAGLPTILVGFSAGETAENVVELSPDALDGDVGAALRDAFDRQARPVDPSCASASLNAIVDGLLSAIGTDRPRSAAGYDLADAGAR